MTQTRPWTSKKIQDESDGALFSVVMFTAGFKCFRVAALRRFDLSRIRSEGYCFQIEVSYAFARNGFRVAEIPILFEERRAGQSKMSLGIVLESLTKVWTLGVFAALFWSLNRWTLFVVNVNHVDFLPILCLLGSMVLFETRRRASLLLFGLSLALKQIAILVTPLYLIWTWPCASDPGARLRGSPRPPGGSFSCRGCCRFRSWSGMPRRSCARSFSRLPATRTPTSVRCPSTPYFNSVFYLQYMTWIVPFLVLAVLDRRPRAA